MSHNPTHPTPHISTVSLPVVNGSRVPSSLLEFGGNGNNWLARLEVDLRDPVLGLFLRSRIDLNSILQITATLPEVRQLFVQDPFGFWGRGTVNPSDPHYVACMDVIVAFWRHLQVGLTDHEYNMNAHIIVPAANSRSMVYGTHDFRRVDRLGDMHYLVGFVLDDAGEVMTAVLSNLRKQHTCFSKHCGDTVPLDRL